MKSIKIADIKKKGTEEVKWKDAVNESLISEGEESVTSKEIEKALKQEAKEAKKQARAAKKELKKAKREEKALKKQQEAEERLARKADSLLEEDMGDDKAEPILLEETADDKPETVLLEQLDDEKPEMILSEEADDDKPAKKRKEKRMQSIRNTLMASFVIPVVLMVILGVVSYNIASSVVMTKYKESALSTVEAVGNYFGLVCDTVASKSMEMITNSDIKDYYTMYFRKNDGEAIASINAARTTIKNVTSNNKQIFDCNIVSERAVTLTSTTGATIDNAFEKFKATAEGDYLVQNNAIRNSWLGYHTYIDEIIDSSAPDKYCIAYYQKLTSPNDTLVMGIDMEVFDNMVSNMDFGKGSVSAMISQDGREVSKIQGIDGLSTETYFVGQDFYENTKATESSGTQNVVLNGEKYVYVYTPVGETGVMVCALIPQNNMVGEMGTIKHVTVVVVLLSAVIALVIGLVIATGIGTTVKKMSGGLAVVEQGDLTNEFETKRKDEFYSLTKSLNSMLASLRGLISDMKSFSYKVNDMASEVYEQTETVNTSMGDISVAMNEVALGVQNQAQETEVSTDKMLSLSNNINAVTDKANVMVQTADGTIAAIEQGKTIVATINEKSEQTVEITKVLVDNIRDVEKQSFEIKEIVDIINGIAAQTNLLSLNASIEAARAGEAGRGFAVVAEEIRKLADQSKESGNQIRKIVESIESTSTITAGSVKEAEGMVLEQADALAETVNVFTMIHESVGELVQDIHAIMERLEAIVSEKDVVHESIQNIAAVSQEVSAATQEVSATLEEQASVMNRLAQEVETLKSDVSDLGTSIDSFKI